MEKLLSVHEAATMLGLAPKTLYNLAARDQIPVQRVRRRVMFRPSALDRWLDDQSRHESADVSKK
jgi:excisionase family DNA binding protein